MKRIGIGELERLLDRLNGKSYNAYRRLRGLVIDYGFAEAVFTKIQGDPHATPSILEVTIPYNSHKFPKDLLKAEFLTPFTDYLARVLFKVAKRFSWKCGSGYSGFIGIPKPSPRILRRSCVEVKGDDIVVRLFVGLPARGRRILGNKAKIMLLKSLPEIIKLIML